MELRKHPSDKRPQLGGPPLFPNPPVGPNQIPSWPESLPSPKSSTPLPPLQEPGWIDAVVAPRVLTISQYPLPSTLGDIVLRAEECLDELGRILSTKPYKGFITGRVGLLADRVEIGNLRSMLAEIKEEAQGRGVVLFMGVPVGRKWWMSFRRKVENFARDLGRLLSAMLKRVWITTQKAIVRAWEKFWEGVPKALPTIVEALVEA